MKDHASSEIMTKKLVTIGAQASLTEAYRLMQTRKIRHLPVVDDKGAIVGILSDRDLQRAMSPKKKDIHELTFEFDPEFIVRDFMSWPVKTVAHDMSVRDVAQRMLKEKLSALLVVDADQKHKGIVTTDDMLRLLIMLLEKDPTRIRTALGSIMDDFHYGGQFI